LLIQHIFLQTNKFFSCHKHLTLVIWWNFHPKLFITQE